MFYFLNRVKSISYTNTVITNDVEDPAVFKFRDEYHMVGIKGSSSQIKSSKDLLTWKIESNSIFGDDGFPKWADKEFGIRSPEVHAIGDKFNLYFWTLNNERRYYKIAVATAENPSGPYKDSGRPLFSIEGHVIFTHIAQEGTVSYINYNRGNIIFLLFLQGQNRIGEKLNSYFVGIYANRTSSSWRLLSSSALAIWDK